MANRLAGSTSPYLRQHADNPVDWHEWGPEAFDRARTQDMPILLSVGYSACHWCHVMAHESFEDARTAALMNAWFVSVKVDREERPDVDAVYMEAVQRLTGHGGWPMTVFLTPSLEPFFGGTYFPPAPRHGLAGFPQVLEAVAKAWRERRADVVAEAARLTTALQRSDNVASTASWTLEEVERAASRLLATHDPVHGGFGGAPKFPPHAAFRFLLGRHGRTGRLDLEAAIVRTLDAMAAGGLYDQLGGGFHRYCVDDTWTVPHFEKMLYDNAQLARTYLCAWLRFGAPRYRVIATETLDYMLRELREEGGAFRAAQDADTADGEGAFFTWRPEQVREVVPGPAADAALAWFGVTDSGNFEGATVLTARRGPAAAAEAGVTVEAMADLVSEARSMLLRARDRRRRPATDAKIVVDWNGLAIDALARAGAALGRDDYLSAALGAAERILALADRDGGLHHSWGADRAGAPAFLEDYASMAGAFVSLYEATFDPAWVLQAVRLLDVMLDGFSDRDGGFFRTGPLHRDLIVRQKDVFDASVPSGNALAADALLRVAALTGKGLYADAAAGAMRSSDAAVRRLPGAAGAMLAVVDDYLAGVREVAVVGPDPGRMLAAIRRRCRPGVVVACSAVPVGPDHPVALLAHRAAVDGATAAYVCRGHVCDAPTTSAAELERSLGGV